MATQRPPSGPQSRTRLIYLTAYNLVSASLWASVLINTLSHATDSPLTLFRATEPQARWIQTLSLIEVLHAALGIIKSPVGTTALQVVTRAIQVWMVWFCFPSSTAPSRAYLALVLAWSIADSIRYFYLALNLHGRAPRALVWLRYTMFYPLYPIGIGAEWWLLYRSIEPAGEISSVIPPIFYFFLVLYIPGAYTMYTYMMKQRRKTLKPAQKSG